MCLAVPSRVTAIEGKKAKVELVGVTRTVDITLVPKVKVGDYVLVHTGYAITVIDEMEAQETLKLFDELIKY
jgi:hydrogenase expression/formation protein HypC